MAKVLYAVMALKKGQPDEVVKILREQNLESAALWLEANKKRLYGNRNEDWRPFAGPTLEEMLREKDDEFQSLTLTTIESLPDSPEEIANASLSNLSKVQIFFVDLFALFLPKYRELAKRLDLLLATSSEQRSCLALAFGLTPDIEPLLARYSAAYPVTADSYVKGSHHRIALRPDDLSNFRNHIGSLYRDVDRPDPSADSAASAFFGKASGRVPRWSPEAR